MSGRRLAVLALIVLLVAATAQAALGQGRATRAGQGHTTLRRLYVDGDSIAYGTGLFLSRYLPGWAVTSAVDVSRHAYQGAAAIEALEKQRTLPSTVVVNLGTNDDPRAMRQFGSYVRRVVQAAGPERCVIWATIIRPPYSGVSYDGLNKVLFDAAGRWQSFHVYDWRSLAHAHPGWFGSDGVHPSIPGYRLRAKSLAAFIRTTCT